MECMSIRTSSELQPQLVPNAPSCTTFPPLPSTHVQDFMHMRILSPLTQFLPLNLQVVPINHLYPWILSIFTYSMCHIFLCMLHHFFHSYSIMFVSQCFLSSTRHGKTQHKDPSLKERARATYFSALV